jgi:HAD superfamily phosphatase (TIGR01681 family)
MRRIETALARTIRSRRYALGAALMGSIAGWEKFAHGFVDDADARAEFIQQEMLGFVDYLAIYFERGDISYRDLYIGEKLKQSYDPADSPDASLARRREITTRDREILTAQLKDALDEAQMAALLALLDEIQRIVTDPGRTVMKVLLIGDCLHLDVVAFLTAPLLASGIKLETSFATSKNPLELHRSLRELRDRPFDLIFYSPFSYAFDLEYSQLTSLKTAIAGPGRWSKIVESAKAGCASTLKLLGELFEAPVLVHNSANIRRHDRSLLERTKNAITYPARAYTRKRINAWLPTELDARNSASFRHFFLLDEMPLLARQSEDELGSFFYDTDLQHPAEFGRGIAAIYLDFIAAQALYAKKKVLVCDLDNTLWAGVIGEGAVTHFADRQATLKALRHKGILLAINSKNDPRNVHWKGSVLSEDDFVSAQINWESKVQNLRRIAGDLNLKLKDFLFVDDRVGRAGDGGGDPARGGDAGRGVRGRVAAACLARRTASGTGRDGPDARLQAARAAAELPRRSGDGGGGAEGTLPPDAVDGDHPAGAGEGAEARRGADQPDQPVQHVRHPDDTARDDGVAREPAPLYLCGGGGRPLREHGRGLGGGGGGDGEGLRDTGLRAELPGLRLWRGAGAGEPRSSHGGRSRGRGWSSVRGGPVYGDALQRTLPPGLSGRGFRVGGERLGASRGRGGGRSRLAEDRGTATGGCDRLVWLCGGPSGALD